MKQSEKLELDAESQRRLIDGFRKEIDLRAGQIDKLQQEMDSYKREAEKAQSKHDEINALIVQEREKEEAEEERKQQQQIALRAAENMNDDR